MNHLTNRRCSDGTHLDGRHGISELCDGSSWRCITKRDRLSWFGLTRFRTTVRVSKQEQVMFESSSKSRKSRNGWQMTWQWVPDIWSNRWKRFGGCDSGFTWGNTYRQNWSRAECSRRYIFWDERCKIGWLLKLEYPEKNRSDFKANSVANRKPMQIRKNRCNVAEPRFLCDHSSESILNMLKASEIWNGCASQERVAIIKSRADYCYSYGFRSLSSKRSTDVTQRTNMEITSLTCFRHLLIKGHFWVKVNTKILNWCLKLNRRASNRDRSNRLSQSSERFGSGVVKSDGLWLGWVQVKTIIQKPVVNSLSARFNWSNLSSQRWRVSTYIKLSVISILMEGHCVILVWLIRIYYICDWRYEKNKKQWSKNRALRHACEYGGGRWGRRINFHKVWAVC